MDNRKKNEEKGGMYVFDIMNWNNRERESESKFLSY